jgi:hypothetical protein
VFWFSHRSYIVLSWELLALGEFGVGSLSRRGGQEGIAHIYILGVCGTLEDSSPREMWSSIWATPDVAVNGPQKALVGVGGERLGG